MFISLYTCPTVLLFVCSAFSVDVYKNEGVPRDRWDIDRSTYTLNHPPAIGDYDTIPVTVLYNDDEEKVQSESKPVLDKSDKTEENNKVLSDNSDEIIVTDFSDSNKGGLKPKARSLSSQFRVAKAVDAVLQSSNDNKRNNTRRVQRRRVQKVRKTQVNKNDTEVGTNKSTKIKVPRKENNEYTTQKTVIPNLDKLQVTTTRSQKRTRTRDPVVPIIESENYVYSHKGNFHYSYEGGDGTRAFERGELKTSVDGSGMGESVVGSYSYTDKDGNDFSLSYTADENGYRPVGAHLPTPPPVPPEIQAALRLLATKTTPETVTERVKKT